MSEFAGASNPEFIVARDVHKHYAMAGSRIEVLRGVDLSLHAGALVTLRGASGSGKSTLLHLLGGLDQPTQGTVSLAGQRLDQLPARELARWRNRRVGFVFQAYHLLPELDALENVALPARMARTPPPEAEQHAADLLRRVGLGHRLDHRPSELSGGEQQRVAIARALVNNPELVLADEPTGNLDSRTGEEIVDLLCTLQTERRVTLLIATHDHHVAARAPRLLELTDGRVSLCS